MPRRKAAKRRTAPVRGGRPAAAKPGRPTRKPKKASSGGGYKAVARKHKIGPGGVHPDYRPKPKKPAGRDQLLGEVTRLLKDPAKRGAVGRGFTPSRASDAQLQAVITRIKAGRTRSPARRTKR